MTNFSMIALSLAITFASFAAFAGVVSWKSVAIKPTHPIHYNTYVTAKKYVGLNEKKHRKKLKKLLGVDPVRVQWCAAFVNSVLAEIKVKPTGKLNARSYLKWGKKVKLPKRGDVVIFSRGKNPALGHVGFFVKFEKRNGKLGVITLGGNQKNSVNLQWYNADRVLGYREAK